MKKAYALLLALVMVFALCACGDDESIRGTQTDNNPTEAPTEKEAVETVPLEMGQTSGLNYESSYVGIGCNLPEGWVFYTDEEIDTLNSLTSELVGEEYQQSLQNADLLYDMHAISAEGSSTNVVLEKGSALELLVLDLDTYMENTAPTVADAMKSMGFESYDYEITTVTIDGEEFVCMLGVGTMQDLVLYQYSIPVKCSGHLATISITGVSQEDIDNTLSCFYLVD